MRKKTKNKFNEIEKKGKIKRRIKRRTKNKNKKIGKSFWNKSKIYGTATALGGLGIAAYIRNRYNQPAAPTRLDNVGSYFSIPKWKKYFESNLLSKKENI